MLLYDARENRLLAIMDAVHITAVRTGAGGGLAARYLARRDAQAVGILGSGVQARVNLEATCLELPGLSRVRVYSRGPANREAFAREMAGRMGLSIEPVGEPEAALAGADLIITATNSPQPLLRREWVRPGACVLMMGIKTEVDPACFLGAKIVVDGMDVAQADGKIAAALASGAIRRGDIYAELAELVAGRKPGRTSADEIFYFDSSGLAVQDIACAAHCYRRAEGLGLGTVVDLEDGEA
jgi:alanine dehydrogenase